MSIYAIADLHLPFGVEKPMDIFGTKWENYTQKIKKNWELIINNEDTVIIPGDISWATYLNQSYKDFCFINNLPGQKIILKGNHDYWWTTLHKLNNFVKENNFNSINFLHNNYYIRERFAICGTRGWMNEENENNDSRILLREIQRLEISLKEASKYGAEKILVAMHYPPISKNSYSNEFTKIMNQYNVIKCIYGHLHGESQKEAINGIINGIEYILVSGDFIDFKPVKIA
jgi:predicted phosphohydrolase